MVIPPKMKIFLWTIVSKKLLTNVQRRHRKFTSDDSCFHCFGTPENFLHLFRNCPKAMLVWSSFCIPPVMATAFHLDWNGWLSANLLQDKCFYLNIPWNVLFTITCWHIWKWRCNCIFDSRFNLPYDMKNVIFSYANDWLNAVRKKAKVQVSQTVMLRWIRPPPNFVKINVDGSLNRHGSIGAGGIMRDPSGSWISGFMINLGSGDILKAEAWGLFYGIQLAIRCGQQSVEFESDSESLISLLTDDVVAMHPLGTIIMNCQTLAKALPNCSFRHVHRERNYAADFLAKASLGNEHGIIWLNACPPALANFLLDDISGAAKARRIPTHRPCHPTSSVHEHGGTSSQIEVNENAATPCWFNRHVRGSAIHEDILRDVHRLADVSGSDHSMGTNPDCISAVPYGNDNEHAIRDGHVIPND